MCHEHPKKMTSARAANSMLDVSSDKLTTLMSLLCYNPLSILNVNTGILTDTGGILTVIEDNKDNLTLCMTLENRILLINCVLWIQYVDPWRACTLFLLLPRLSSEETMSTRLTHDLGCNWTDEFPHRLL